MSSSTGSWQRKRPPCFGDQGLGWLVPVADGTGTDRVCPGRTDERSAPACGAIERPPGDGELGVEQVPHGDEAQIGIRDDGRDPDLVQRCLLAAADPKRSGLQGLRADRQPSKALRVAPSLATTWMEGLLFRLRIPLRLIWRERCPQRGSGLRILATDEEV